MEQFIQEIHGSQAYVELQGNFRYLSITIC